PPDYAMTGGEARNDGRGSPGTPRAGAVADAPRRGGYRALSGLVSRKRPRVLSTTMWATPFVVATPTRSVAASAFCSIGASLDNVTMLTIQRYGRRRCRTAPSHHRRAAPRML